MNVRPSHRPSRGLAVTTAALTAVGSAVVLAVGQAAPVDQATLAPPAVAVSASPAAAPAPVPTVGRRTTPAPSPVVVPAAADRLRATQEAAGLQCDTTASGAVLCGHGEDAPRPAGPAPVVEVLGGQAALPCHGDGTSGPRIRTVYARPEGAPDRFAATAASFRSWVAAVDRDVSASAARTGGRRHLRLATTPGPDCALSVVRVTLPAAAFRTFRATVDALQAKGLSRPDAKYLVWADADVYCGIASMFVDDSPGQDNLNNGGTPGYARVDRRCWGSAETHEVVHMLGGIQRSARNATAGHHCRDGHDVMCYDDGSPDGRQRTVCAASAARLLDCGNDDYFSTAPARGSYLATHWNTARSAFLSTTSSQPAPTARPSSPPPPRSTGPSPSPSPSPAPSPSPSPSPSGIVDGLLELLPGVGR